MLEQIYNSAIRQRSHYTKKFESGSHAASFKPPLLSIDVSVCVRVCVSVCVSETLMLNISDIRGSQVRVQWGAYIGKCLRRVE